MRKYRIIPWENSTAIERISPDQTILFTGRGTTLEENLERIKYLARPQDETSYQIGGIWIREDADDPLAEGVQE